MEEEKKYRKKKKLGSYPIASAVFSNTLALLVIGLFGLLVLHAHQLTTLIQENLELQVYLEKDMTEANRIKINKILASKAFTANKDQVPQINFISKEQAAKEFFEESGEDAVGFLGENPLRDAFILKLKPAYYQTDSLQQVQAEIEEISGVFEVTYVRSLIESINENITKIGLVLLGFVIILLLVVIILINNTIKLALFSQRFLIRSMQLVGATSRFIRQPFLFRSVWQGLLSGLLASAFLYLVLSWTYTKLEDLRLLADEEKMLILFGSLIVAGIIISYFSTRRAINKYLKMSLDELY
ncbi:cell division protein FtsX [Nafulsella turpanensis]|uniref:cell division protein FtsX n=1 Tax=Nafulsella turpanensis TaxID=1265690 RepID=UPI00034A09EE|nr:permease-like cell division protein FtsX [Nafulsella turpanensis]